MGETTMERPENINGHNELGAAAVRFMPSLSASPIYCVCLVIRGSYTCN
jgi:hypothetical protein